MEYLASVCLSLGAQVVGLHVWSDAVIALSYYSIPFALVYFAWKRSDLSFRWMFVLFGAFILACGTTHFMHVWTLAVRPDFLIEGWVKAVTALVSLATAVMLWPLIPRALALPSPAQLAAVNRALEVEIAERHLAERKVTAANASLEARVRERTEALEEANLALREAKEEAERANMAKSKFLAAASHDLRQPAQAMVYFITALSHRLKDHPAREVVNDLGQSVTALGALLDSLLDVSKLDAGLVQPTRTVFAVSTLLEAVGAELRPAATARGLEVRVVACSAVVESDVVLLTRILRNLGENALRYTPRGRILIGCRRRGGLLRIEVWDTGIGIDDDHLQDVFNEFYQVANPERDRTQGLGLGLAIVDRLSTLLGHRLSVRSRLGHGSVFAIDVPLARQDAADQALTLKSERR